MKVFEIFEAKPKDPNLVDRPFSKDAAKPNPVSAAPAAKAKPSFQFIVDNGEIIDTGTGKVVPPGELFEKTNPAVARQLRSSLRKLWLESFANKIFGWVFFGTPYVAVLLKGAYDLSAVNAMWQNAMISPKEGMSPGAAAADHRSKITADVQAQLYAIALTQLTLGTLRLAANKVGFETVANALKVLAGKRGPNIQRLSAYAIVMATIYILQTDAAKNYLVNLCLSAFPQVFTDIADAAAGVAASGLVIPATISRQVDQVIRSVSGTEPAQAVDKAVTGAGQGARDVIRQVPGASAVAPKAKPTLPPQTYSDQLSRSAEEVPLTPAELEKLKRDLGRSN